MKNLALQCGGILCHHYTSVETLNVQANIGSCLGSTEFHCFCTWLIIGAGPKIQVLPLMRQIFLSRVLYMYSTHGIHKKTQNVGYEGLNLDKIPKK